MSLKSIKIFDSAFHGCLYSTTYQTSEYLTWDRTPVTKTDSMVVYTDQCLPYVNPEVKLKIAWLIEPPEISTFAYNWIRVNHSLFDIVLTHQKDLLGINDKFKFYPFGGCWINNNDRQIYDKNKLCSIVASNKQQTYGHCLRHDIIKQLSNFDVYGNGYNPIQNKITSLKEYAFQIVIENCKKDYWFTEKLIDCFVTGTIPIYWGCQSIGNFFDVNGMIIFNTIDELKEIINNLTVEKYQEMLPYVLNNFERAKNYLLAEDWIYNNIFKKLDLI